MSRHRLAIVGLGMAVTPHARGLVDLADRIEVAAAFSPTAARREAFAATYGWPVVDSLDAILTDRSITSVLVLTPPNSHADIALACLKAGKHVLLEKPIETSTARAQTVVDAARAAGLTLGIVFQNRFRPAALAFKALIEDGRLGAIVSASARTWNWRPQSYYDQPGRGTLARDGGGVLLTQAIHTLDLLVWLAGSPETVAGFARTSPIHTMETEDIGVAALAYANGAVGTVAATTGAYPGFPERIEIIGVNGTATLEGTVMRAALQDGTTLEIGDEAAGGGTGADPMAFPHAYHQALIADFVAAVEAGREPLVSGAQALQVHRLIDAILASQGKPTRVVT